MRTHLALLRGINVGGHNLVAMADLREIVAALGHRDVATYIQSGNVVFSSDESDTDRLAEALEKAISRALSVHPSVVVLSRHELAQVVRDNPFPDESDPKHLHAVFHRAAIGAETRKSIAAAERFVRDRGGNDQAVVVGRTLFLRTPDGIGRSELAARLTKPPTGRTPGAVGTARNWATVGRLLALLGD